MSDKSLLRFFLSLIVTLGFSIWNVTAVPLTAQDIPPAPITNDEGGPVVLTGQMSYTNPFFTDGISYPLIILEDQAGFVDRDRGFLFPPQSQTLGQLTSDFYSSPVNYSLALPIEPQGSLRDVDQDSETETGVMIFAVAYWANIWGDPFLEERDQQGGGWSTAYASTRVSVNPERDAEIVGGKYLVYAPDDQQGFPSAFGADTLLFTEDDPIVRLPQGYTVVNLDTTPFTFDRARRQVIDLIEPTEIALVDYSNLSYTAAFDALVEKFRNEYAFTEFKGIDWDTVSAKYRTYFEEADATSNSTLYAYTLGEVLWSIPDGHVALSPLTPLLDQFRERYINGIGVTIQETDDGRSYVIYVLEGSEAESMGIQRGAEILSIDGRPIGDAISRARPWGQAFSTLHNRRLGQMRYATRFSQSVGSVELTYQNEGDASATTLRLTPFQELDSLFYDPSPVGSSSYDTPVEYELLPEGFVYVRVPSFNDDRALTIQLWERMIRELKSEGNLGLIIDMRENGGGSGFLADQMTAYFFDEPLVVGRRGNYSEDTGDFVFDARSEQRLYLPPSELRYQGRVAVLIGPNCASACERFAYNLTLENRGVVIGHYPTAGLGGSVEDFRMPLNLTVRFTTGRSVDPSGQIHIEGTGVEPSLRIPLTREALFTESDVLLEAAFEALR